MTNKLVAKTSQVRNCLVFDYKILNEVTPFARCIVTSQYIAIRHT